MRPLGVHHVSINVSDVAASLAFYTDVLGGVLRDDRPDFRFAGAWIDLGAQQVHLIHAAVPPNNGQHFAIQVGDLAAVVEELRAKGLPVSDPFTINDDCQMNVEDPDGNLVELHQVGRST